MQAPPMQVSLANYQKVEGYAGCRRRESASPTDNFKKWKAMQVTADSSASGSMTAINLCINKKLHRSS
jgi:hypothetical protein